MKKLSYFLITTLLVGVLGYGVYRFDVPFARAAIAYDNGKSVGYTGSGGNSTSFTTAGSNICVVLFVWWDTGAPSSVTYAGTTMPLAITHASLYSGATGHNSIFVLPNASSGANTVSYGASGQTVGLVESFNGCSGTQPDATRYNTGATTTCNSFNCYTLDITTVADNSMVTGLFEDSGCFFNQGPTSSNGTYTNLTYSLIEGEIWYSTSPVTPAGAFGLVAKNNCGGNAEATGVSLAPFVAASTATPHAQVIFNKGQAIINKEQVIIN